MTPENIETVINTLADKLSVPASAVWDALITGARFQILDPIIAFVVFIPAFIVMLSMIKKINKAPYGWDDPNIGRLIAVFIPATIISTVSFLIFITSIKQGIIGLLAPNVIAINKLIYLIGK